MSQVYDRVALIGLGLIASSIFWASKRNDVSGYVTGFARSKETRDIAKKIGFSPIDTGPLKNSRYLEGMAHLNIQIAFGQGKGADVAFLYDH